MSDDRTTWPVPVEALGPSSVATVVFRHRAAFHLTVVVKGSFQWVQGGRAQPMAPAPIERFDRPWDGDPARSLERGTELAPFLPRAEVLLSGHAYAPPGAMVPAASVRLNVFREAARIEKTVHVYGERRTVRDAPRPFQRMPLRWELAWGGPGTANPVGTSAARASAANLVAPDDPSRPVSFGPTPRAWPARARRATQLHGLEPPVFDLDDDLDFAVFQSAPDDQLVDQLVGDEWLLVDGVHPSLPRLSTQLPAARAAALVWCEHGASAGMRWSPPLALDMVMIDADRLRLDAVWRGSFTLPGGDAMLPDMRAAAGLETDAPLAWPDVDAALRTRRLRVPAPRAEDVLHNDRTLAHMPTTGDVLPFAAVGPARVPATTDAAEPADAEDPALPWDPTPPRRRAITRIIPPSAGDTPLPGDEPSLPVLPFAPPTADGVLADPTDADDQQHDDVESTFESLGTSSTAPPEAGEALDVEVPRPPPAPVLVPPPAVGPARMLGGFSLSYDGEREGAQEVSPPEVPPPIAPPSPPIAPPSGSSSIPAPPDPRADVERRLRAGESLEGASLARLDLSGVDFGDAQLGGADLTGATLRGCRLVGARLVEAKLAGADLEGADLERADLTRAKLERARLVGARLVGATLASAGLQNADASTADLTDVKGARASFARARLVDAKLVRADLPGADLTGCQLGGADLSGATLSDAILEEAQAEGARFGGARLLRVRAHGARLVGAHLEGVDASGSAWDRATLDGASFDGATLTDASLLRVSLAGASFADADLRGAKLANATGDDAILTGARLDGADLRQARLEGARLDGARLVKLVGTRASLGRASLVGAELRGANLRGASLKQADLTRASLRDADLRDADLEGALLEGADTAGARLQGANLVDATGVDPTMADR